MLWYLVSKQYSMLQCHQIVSLLFPVTGKSGFLLLVPDQITDGMETDNTEASYVWVQACTIMYAPMVLPHHTQ